MPNRADRRFKHKLIPVPTFKLGINIKLSPNQHCYSCTCNKITTMTSDPQKALQDHIKAMGGANV